MQVSGRRVNMVAEKMWFISNGPIFLTVSSADEEEDPEKVTAELGRGESLGELSFLFDLRRNQNAKTPRDTSALLYRLTKEDWNLLTRFYEQDKEALIKNALARFEQQEQNEVGAGGTMQSASTGISGTGSKASSGGLSGGGTSLASGSKAASDVQAVEGLDKVKKVLQEVKTKRRKERMNALLSALADGYTEEVKATLASGDADVNSFCQCEETALHVAAREGHFELVKILIEDWSADVGVKDRFGNTPLSDAVRHRHDDVIDVLLHWNAPLKLDMAGSILIRAAANGEVEHLKRIVRAGGDINERNYDG